jgi:hypothetical protein
MDEDWKKLWGKFAGGFGGLVAGSKIGLGVSPAIALIPVVGTYLGCMVLLGSPIIGLIWGSRFGEKHPGMASMSAAAGLLGAPGLAPGAEGAVEALAEGATETLSS